MQQMYRQATDELRAMNAPMACGHPGRFYNQTPSGVGFCVACKALEAIDLGMKQAKEHDRFWEAMGVKSAEISVDQAIEKWKAMEAVVKEARTAVSFDYVELTPLGDALRHFDEMPKAKPDQETVNVVEADPEA